MAQGGRRPRQPGYWAPELGIFSEAAGIGGDLVSCHIRTYHGTRISERSPVVAGALSDHVGCLPAALTPRPGQTSASSAGATT
ncbi:hypothetical protein MRX96_031393 [Rhipicephalus microplus]